MKAELLSVLEAQLYIAEEDYLELIAQLDALKERVARLEDKKLEKQQKIDALREQIKNIRNGAPLVGRRVCQTNSAPFAASA